MKVRAIGTAGDVDRFVAEMRQWCDLLVVSRPYGCRGGSGLVRGVCGGAGAMTPRTDRVRPTAGYLGRGSDDYVVRVSLPGAVVHDCTLSQARAFDLELRSVIATAEAAEQRDRRVRR